MMKKRRVSPENKVFLGVDVGSVSTNIVIMDEEKTFLQNVTS